MWGSYCYDRMAPCNALEVLCFGGSYCLSLQDGRITEGNNLIKLHIENFISIQNSMKNVGRLACMFQFLSLICHHCSSILMSSCTALPASPVNLQDYLYRPFVSDVFVLLQNHSSLVTHLIGSLSTWIESNVSVGLHAGSTCFLLHGLFGYTEDRGTSFLRNMSELS
jgi:hypothetical protein